MCLSIFLAQLIGCYLLIISVAMLLFPHRFQRTISEFVNSMPLLTLSGGLSILIGLILVIGHNVWVADWPVLITLIGWITLLQGMMRIFFPEHFVRFIHEMQNKVGYTLMTWVWLIIGVYLVWVGFSQ